MSANLDIVISVTGPQGCGKTTVLNMIYEMLEKHGWPRGMAGVEHVITCSRPEPEDVWIVTDNCGNETVYKRRPMVVKTQQFKAVHYKKVKDE